MLFTCGEVRSLRRALWWGLAKSILQVCSLRATGRVPSLLVGRAQCSAYADTAEAVAEPQEEPCRHPPELRMLRVQEVNTAVT